MAKIRLLAAFAFIWALLGASKTFAQNPSNYYEEVPQLFYGGVLAGANFTQVDGDAYAGYHKVGLNLGGIMYARFAEHLAGSIEILFSQKGSRGHFDQQLNNSDTFLTQYGIKLNYAEIPLQLNYFDRRRSHFGAGFSYSQLITGAENIQVQRENRTYEIPTEQYPFRKADLNVLLSGNLHLVKGLFLNARFQYSLLAIRRDHPPGIGRDEQYNNMWTLRLMYLF